MSVVRRAFAFVGLVLLILVVLAFGAGRISCYAQDGAHGHGHAENHDWYRELYSNQGYSCCNALTAEGEGDCRPAAVWRELDGSVWTRISGRRMRVPDDAVLPDSKNLRPLTGHVCEKNGTFYCALVGGAGG